MSKLIVNGVAAAALLAAVSTVQAAPSYNMPAYAVDADAAITVAKAEAKAAGKLGFEWRDTGKMIKEAEAALKAGDSAKALKLANKARMQGILGQRQAHDQANAGPRF